MASPQSVRVLFVDDEEDIAEAYAALLQALYGWTVTRALSGKEALRLLKQHTYDVIVSDYRMPQMSGVELLQKARQLAPQTPFVMLTAYGDAELEATAVGAGAARFLGKSESPQAIATAIQEAMARPGVPPAGKPGASRKPTRKGPSPETRGEGANGSGEDLSTPAGPAGFWDPGQQAEAWDVEPMASDTELWRV